MLEYSQRLRERARAVLARPERSTGRTLFEAAARGGAQAAMRDAGTLAPGRLADLLALDRDAVDLAGKQGDAVLDSFIFAGGNAMVTDLWSAGVTWSRTAATSVTTRSPVATPVLCRG